MKSRALRFLEDLVAIRSVSGDEARAADYASRALAVAGLDVERLGQSVVARIARGKGPRLLLNSHLDTVPAGDGWTREPFAATWEGEKLFGRGSNDAKASVASMMSALIECAEHADFEGEVILALTACEETTNAGMGDVLAKIGMPDGACTGEPTGLEVVRAQSGLAIFVAEWKGKACHAAHVARVPNRNALLDASAELAGTAPYLVLDGEHALLGPSTAVATVFKSGERSNVVPDRAEAVIDARLSPLHAASDVVELLKKKLPRAEIRIRSERLKPIETAADHPLVRAALAAAQRAQAIGSSTMSDMALLVGVPAVKCGPGETARSHTSDEFVLASEVEAGEAFYRRFIPTALAALATSKVHA